MTTQELTRQQAAIERWMRVFHPIPGDTVEVRVLDVQGARARSRIFADLTEAAAWAAEQDGLGARGTYWTANPLRPDLAGATKAANAGEVLCRRWLLIDCDPVNPPKTNSSETQRNAAWSVLCSCQRTLETNGLAGAVIGDSGNGWHLCYPINLPCDQASQDLVKDCLKHLGTFSLVKGARVDPTTHDAPRIWKCYGTKARKGPIVAEVRDEFGVVTTEARPQRWSRLVSGDPWDPVVASCNTIALKTTVERWNAAERLRGGKPTGEALSVVERARRYVSAMPPAIAGQGGHNRTWDVAQVLVRGFGLEMGPAWEILCTYNDRCQPPWNEKDLRHKLEDASKNSKLPSGYLLEENHPQAGPSAHGPSASSSIPDGDLILPASSVETREVEWLWPGRIPLGKLSTFAGQGGLGKTFTLCDLAARVSRGLPWPDGLDTPGKPGRALIVSGEDDPEDTLVRRLIALGADLERVNFLRTPVLDRFNLADLTILDRIADQVGPELRMVAIDPPTAFLCGIDDHKNAELRALLSPLKSWAFRRRVAVIFNTHLNKGGNGKTDAMVRVMGSVAWVNAVRAAYLFVKDPDDETRRFFVPMKMNLARERPGLAYRIVSTTGEWARVEWLGEIKMNADEAVSAKVRPRQQAAADWLVERFREKREWPSDELFDRGKQEGINRKAIFEAKASLDLPKAVRTTYPDGSTIWVWRVPPDWPPLFDGMPGPGAE